MLASAEQPPDGRSVERLVPHLELVEHAIERVRLVGVRAHPQRPSERERPPIAWLGLGLGLGLELGLGLGLSLGLGLGLALTLGLELGVEALQPRGEHVACAAPSSGTTTRATWGKG